MPKVFISYSHDSDDHRNFVRELSDRLRNNGVECLIDQYINGFPPEGWQTWMENQIEEADFVLLICTEIYLRRYRKKEIEGGKGVTFEGVLVSQHLYDAHYRNVKFIPVIPEHGSYDHVPTPLKSYSTYCLPDQYDDVYRVLTGQAQYVPPKLGSILKLGRKVKVDRLPTVIGDFFGREAELKLLDDAFLSQNKHANTRIIQFIAAGGTGKTKLLRHWLNKRENQINNYLVWSFYSQGTSDSKQVSATPLFTEAFKAFGIDTNDYNTDEDRADALADYLTEHQCLLVLDGLEPLQHGGNGFNGQLKDRAMKRLLQRIAQQHSSLCIITTRIPVHELSDRVYVVSHPLDNLHPNDGMQLLRSLTVQGSDKELQAAVNEVKGHALTLHLLGNAITTYLDGDIRKRDTLEELVDDFDEPGRHAFKVMQGYQHWFTDDDGKPMAELQLLYLLGLFDHPIEKSVLQALFQEESFQKLKIRIQTSIAYKIRDLNWFKRIITRLKLSYKMANANTVYRDFISPVKNISEKQLERTLANLRDKHHLLSTHSGRPDLLDFHPLIREYFGRQLQQQQPDAWQQAHETLYHYYKSLAKDEQPKSIEAMQPLFHAVAHGCAAGLHQQVLDEVCGPRIWRGDYYLTKELGAFSDDLAVVAYFFDQPWSVPAEGLSKTDQLIFLGVAGFDLHAVGRSSEALGPYQANIEVAVKEKRWNFAAHNAGNLSELQLILGQVSDAVSSGKLSVGYADRAGHWFRRMNTRTIYANALCHAGQPAKAIPLFVEAEQIQQEYQPECQLLYSSPGFKYCDLLLTLASTVNDMSNDHSTLLCLLNSGLVTDRAEHALELAKQESLGLITIALDQLSLGRAHHIQNDLSSSRELLAQAVRGFRESGYQYQLPLGLLARAALWRDLNEYRLALQDLNEVWEIAEPSGMRLFMTDYHLEMARLLLKNPMPSSAAEEKAATVADHINAAESLINETGYHRRDNELAALRKESVI